MYKPLIIQITKLSCLMQTAVSLFTTENATKKTTDKLKFSKRKIEKFKKAEIQI